MSRTIRRKNCSYDSFWYTRDWVEYESKYGGRFDKRIQVEGKERQKRLNHYHSDSKFGWSAPKWIRQCEHSKHRTKAKSEIIKYYKDKEHEIQIRSNPRWPWWD